VTVQRLHDPDPLASIVGPPVSATRN